MARLTTFSRFLITLLIVAGVYFGVTKFLGVKLGGGGFETTTGTTTETTTDASSSTADAGTATSAGASVAQAPKSGGSFTYTPPAPNGGTKRGVVVVGAAGFDSFIITMDDQKNYRVDKKEFGTSLVKEGMSSDQDIREGLKSYIAKMLNDGVNGKNIHFVVSSGAQKAPQTQTFIKGLKSLGYVVNPVSASQEGKFGFEAAVPKPFRSNAFMVDIGSGNTKISWMQNGQLKSVETHGAKYFQDGLADSKVYTDILEKAAQIPEASRKTCFIIGGVPFELAKQGRKGEERYTVLNAPESYKAANEKQKAGLNILKAIDQATGSPKTVFDWDANFTIGFLLNLP
jgi:hypothetical protein